MTLNPYFSSLPHPCMKVPFQSPYLGPKLKGSSLGVGRWGPQEEWAFTELCVPRRYLHQAQEGH